MIAGLSKGQLIGAVAAVIALPAAWFLFPKDPLETGTQLARDGRVDDALDVWGRACEKKKHIESCAAAAIIRLQRMEIDEAKALVAKAVAADPKHVWSLVLQGRLLEVEGKPGEAKVFYEEAETLHPDSALPPTSLAKLAIERGDLAEAERCAERAIAAEPHAGSGYAMRGRVLVLTSSLGEAMTAYADAIERDGMLAQDWVALAETFERTGKVELKLEVLEDANRKLPDDPTILTALGMERLQSNDVDGAVEALRRACDLTPIAAPRVYLGITFLESDRPDFAIPRFEEALKITPGDVDVEHLLATARANNVETDAALALMAKILARPDLTKDQRIRTLFLRARTEENAGRVEQALADVKELLVLDPELQDANWLCGHIALDQNRDEDAAKCLTKAATEKGTTEILILRDLARLHARLGKLDESMGYLEVLFETGAIDAGWIKAHPEFRVLEKLERFRLMMEGAIATPPGFAP